MEKLESKKCTKVVPLFFFLTGAMNILAGKGEVGGFSLFVAFLAFCFCVMIDKVNEIPAAAPSTGSNTPWSDDEIGSKPKKKFMEYKDANEGVAGARREIVGPRADFQVTPSRFFAEDRNL
ncbi:hypothetical protein KP003_14400 [Geomonas nitrogeniifigens]|uniref:hypothetical protein n=1 Tax=Geomonas diazotrophica TaxID=2843197 RepID=UPI001C2BCE40|nr:hypothetical protein [Geomonas nitrogeniifigens]QXE85568.1 hypothetical protein KP003_14400 [Geomonas nitrogeniifigens]